MSPPPALGPRSYASGLAPMPPANVRTRVSGTESLPPPVAGDVTSAKRVGPSRVLRALRVAFGLTLIVGIGSGVVWSARHYVCTSPRFAVSEIVTSGGRRRGADDIAGIVGVTKGDNVFSIDLDLARARLMADPWIETAEISRQLPGTISVRITEREASGLVSVTEDPQATTGTEVSGGGGTYLVTRDGAIIKRLDSPDDPLDLHVVTGIALRTLLEDREGATRTIRRALDLASDYDRSPLAQRSPIQEVHVEPNGDMTLVVGKSGVVLRMGAGPYRRKLEQAVRIVGELDRRGAKPDAIMLDDEARPDRAVVRMR